MSRRLERVGATPFRSQRCFCNGDVRSVDGFSSMFDFVLAYSIRHVVGPSEASFQNRSTISAPIVEDELPFTRAATSDWLSGDNTQVRCLSGDQLFATYALSTASRIPYMNIGESMGDCSAMVMYPARMCKDTVLNPVRLFTAAMCPNPCASACAPPGSPIWAVSLEALGCRWRCAARPGSRIWGRPVGGTFAGIGAR